MQYRSLRMLSIRIIIVLGLSVGLAGCYTLLNHPRVANEELVKKGEPELTGTSCTDCHNNEYNHGISPHYGGFGSWGIRYNPYNYYGYYGWERYYYDPWWWGWDYYYPYPYYPGGGGSGGSVPNSPNRPDTRRGLQGAPNFGPPPPAQPPLYNVPPPQSPTNGNSGQGGNQNDNNNNKKRDGRRGKKG